MLYNIEKKKIQTNIDCLTCQYFDNKSKKCIGFGRVCFEYDPKTRVVFDPVTKLPLKNK